MKLTLFLLSSGFATWPKRQDKNLKILKIKRAFEVKSKAFFIIFKGLSVAKNYLRPESASLRRPAAANFAKIIKSGTMLIKTNLKDSKLFIKLEIMY